MDNTIEQKKSSKKTRSISVKTGKPRKEMISIRMDPDVLAWFRKKSNEVPGGSYQRMLNVIAREYMEKNL